MCVHARAEITTKKIFILFKATMQLLPEDNDPCLGEGMLLGMELCRDVLERLAEGLSGFFSDFL